jgi:hypothetical protein
MKFNLGFLSPVSNFRSRPTASHCSLLIAYCSFFISNFSLLWVLLAGATPAPAADPVFSSPISVTADQPVNSYQVSRNPSRSMAVDADGLLHMVFFSGPFATSPQNPSNIFYRTWDAKAGFGPMTKVDNSITDLTSQPIGGRQPSLLLTPNGTVWVTWHDYRNCSGGIAPGNWADNIEIYADSKPKGGDFSNTDIRLTNTPPSPDYLGDNGYSPRLIQRTSGALGVVWYDYHRKDYPSDLYYTQSDTNGVFPTGVSIDTQRITDANDRGLDFSKSFNFVNAAVDNTGAVNFVWTSGTSDEGDLYFSSMSGTGPLTSGTTTPLKQHASGYWNPPQIFASRAGDEVWLLWTNEPISNPTITLRRRVVATGQWDDEIPLPPGGAQRQPDAAFGPDGKIHLTWLNQATNPAQIEYARFDPVGKTIEFRTTVATVTNAYPWPNIVVSDKGYVTIQWTDSKTDKTTSDPDSNVYIVTTTPRPGSAVDNWSTY